MREVRVLRTTVAAASLAILSLAIASCSDKGEIVSPSDAREEDLPGTSPRPTAIPDQNVDLLVRLSPSATLITFSEFPVGTSIADQYRDVGIIFGGSSPFISTDTDNPTSPVLSGTPQFQGPITGTFVVTGTTVPTTVDSFMLDAGWFDDLETTELRWFDSSGTLLGSRRNTVVEGIETMTVTADGIASFSMQIVTTEPAGFAIDNVQFVPSGPGIECTEAGTGEPEVPRGNVVVCNVTNTAGVQSVSEWRFEGENDEGTPLTPIVNTAHDSVAWSGIAVAAGEVSAKLVRDGNEEVVTGSLNVESREWRWSEDDPNGAQERVYTQGSGQECAAWTEGIVDQQGNPIGAILYALNTTKAGFGDCETGYLMPDPTGQDGYEIASIQDLGPNDGVYYVTSGSWHIRRGSLINPFFLENGTAKELTKKPDQKACEGLTAIVDWASFWEFNELCQGNSLSTFIQGLWDHEGVGSLGPEAAEPNGHWGRVDSRAKEPAGDPYRAMEDVVDEDLTALRERVEARVRGVQDALAAAADGQLHLHVRNNFCGLVFMYNGIHGRYDFVQPLQTGGFCI
jgi:hypothetical protein